MLVELNEREISIIKRILKENYKKVDQQIYDIILRKNNDRQSVVIEKGTMEHCLSYIESFYPNFKRDSYNTNYFYKTRGRGMNGEIFIKPSKQL